MFLRILQYIPHHSPPCHNDICRWPLCFWMGSLSLGAIRRFLMVVPPLQCTCTPIFLPMFLILMLSSLYIVKEAPPSRTSWWLLMTRIPSKNRGVIYKYHCDRVDCDEEYIGESLRTFWERFKEHLKPPSPIYDHINISGHNVTINNFKIIGREDLNQIRTIKEALYIRVNDPSLNRNVGKYHLPHVWDEVLFNTSEVKLN